MDWQQRWIDRATPWDLNGPHPETAKIVRILKDLALIPKNILIPGCGKCHDAIPFLAMGAQVTGIDLAPEAIREAKILYGTTPHLELFSVENSDYALKNPGRHDLVFDRAMLCALSPSFHKSYIEMVKSVLNQSGYFVSIAFQKVRSDIEGPPFAIGETEMFGLMRKDFTLFGAYKVESVSPIPAILDETIWIWKKRI